MRDPFRGIGRGLGTHFSGIHLGGSVGALGPIWRPKADIMEAEGRLNGGLGAEPPGIKKVKDLFLSG